MPKTPVIGRFALAPIDDDYSIDDLCAACDGSGFVFPEDRQAAAAS